MTKKKLLLEKDSKMSEFSESTRKVSSHLYEVTESAKTEAQAKVFETNNSTSVEEVCIKYIKSAGIVPTS